MSATNGAVHVVYRNERANLGTYRWFLNPGRREIQHTDSFYVPNVTSRRYEIGAQDVHHHLAGGAGAPTTETLVYTDLTYRFGRLDALAAPFVRRHGQRVIDQDVEILARADGQHPRATARSFATRPPTPSIAASMPLREAIARGEDPARACRRCQREIEFYV